MAETASLASIASIAADLQEQKFTVGLLAELSNSSAYRDALKIKEPAKFKALVDDQVKKLKDSEEQLKQRTDETVEAYKMNEKAEQAGREEAKRERENKREAEANAKAEANANTAEAKSLGKDAEAREPFFANIKSRFAKSKAAANASAPEKVAEAREPFFANIKSRFAKAKEAKVPIKPDDALLAMMALAGLQVNFLNALQETQAEA